MPNRSIRLLAVVALAGLVAACSSSSKSSSDQNAGQPSTGSAVGSSATKTAAKTVKVAVITSASGPLTPLYAGTVDAFKARIDAQNAAGGVNGAQIQVISEDDQSTLQGTLAAAQDAVNNKGAFGVALISSSGNGPGPIRYLHQQGVPVVGASYAGGFGEQPYTNMFAADTGSIDDHYPAFTQPGQFYKDHGATNVAILAFSDPASVGTSKAAALSFKQAGLKVGYENFTLQYGAVNFSTEVIAMKNAGVDAIYAPTSNTTETSLYTQAKQAGINVKVMDQVTTYGSALLQSSSWPQEKGAYFQSEWLPIEVKNAASQAMMANLMKYAGYKANQIPGFGPMEGYLAANLFITGLQAAGANPTRQSFIQYLRQVKGYNAGGLLANTIDYSTIFGHDPNPECFFFLTTGATDFVPVSDQPVCGTEIPNSNQVS